MGLDHSGTTVNVVYAEKFKLKTMRNIHAKWDADPKPLLVVNRFQGILFVGGKEIASIWRHKAKFKTLQSITIDGQCFYHPRQTMEAIERFEQICPAFSTWLIFNIDSLFTV